MIFEDGDLDADGGEGRAQNFRWKNIDAVGDGDDARGNDDDDDDDDSPLVQTMEETETMKKWRKQQFEREQWKKEQGKSKEVMKLVLMMIPGLEDQMRCSWFLPTSM